MPRTPNTAVLTFELPTAHCPSAAELDLFKQFQENPQANLDIIDAYSVKFFKQKHDHNRFEVYTDIHDDTTSHSIASWHVDGIKREAGRRRINRYLTIMSGSMPTYFAKCEAEIRRNFLPTDALRSKFDVFSMENGSIGRYLLSTLIHDVLGIDWVEIASGEAEMTEKFLMGSEAIRVFDAQIMRSLPFVFYSGHISQTLHRAVIKTPEDPSNRLFTRLVHSKKMKRRTRPSDEFIEQLLAQAA